ncbi:hypothetical protein PHISP_03726 [Aspergillus sp. HF37]|nr:hypothetical protein PHISP_03726 [Aspergillus sp. HF37]
MDGECPRRFQRPEEFEEWEVDRIQAVRLYRGKLQYRVRLVGYEEQDPQWYPASNFKNSPQLLRDLHSQYPDLPGPPKDLHRWEEAAEKDDFVEDDQILSSASKFNSPEELTSLFSSSQLEKDVLKARFQRYFEHSEIGFHDYLVEEATMTWPLPCGYTTACATHWPSSGWEPQNGNMKAEQHIVGLQSSRSRLETGYNGLASLSHRHRGPSFVRWAKRHFKRKYVPLNFLIAIRRGGDVVAAEADRESSSSKYEPSSSASSSAASASGSPSPSSSVAELASDSARESSAAPSPPASPSPAPRLWCARCVESCWRWALGSGFDCNNPAGRQRCPHCRAGHHHCRPVPPGLEGLARRVMAAHHHRHTGIFRPPHPARRQEGLVALCDQFRNAHHVRGAAGAGGAPAAQPPPQPSTQGTARSRESSASSEADRGQCH